MIAAPAALTGHDPFGVAYEALRRRVLGAAPFSGPVGLVLLLREGLTGWMAHVALGAASAEPPGHPERCAAASRVSDAIHAAVVDVLASMALSGLKEKSA
ncbi:MAG: hypothetical protein DMD83_16210 [Candidatus Rokuibacteriota bacterium]|nr:MAG: hypothetical protein DMD83_16210 [Candidatus Rokubacteria bacterium]